MLTCARYASLLFAKSTMHDMEGVTHTVEVTAGSLYEAVALGRDTL